MLEQVRRAVHARGQRVEGYEHSSSWPLTAGVSSASFVTCCLFTTTFPRLLNPPCISHSRPLPYSRPLRHCLSKLRTRKLENATQTSESSLFRLQYRALTKSFPSSGCSVGGLAISGDTSTTTSIQIQANCDSFKSSIQLGKVCSGTEKRCSECAVVENAGECFGAGPYRDWCP
ncbi:hypothetical protein BDZ90DRAFT_77937 [Jaminaea rosea]|uniref:Uncharacterized protein n=1 Tax=Jaminaea rosea TaxID=1569628 RepID=A0A316UIK6_9BASI|nr:hypothetical protein BDZ90DRAFT_77937 [Jaminaea rosea]PWN25102.1 hypothetical protein BDZ90DRAFT_77937 [Jaminaea rosea]